MNEQLLVCVDLKAPPASPPTHALRPSQLRPQARSVFPGPKPSHRPGKMQPSELDLGTGDWAEKEKEQLAIKGHRKTRKLFRNK